MGYSCATQRYRFTEWVHYENATGPDWNVTVATELYDLSLDPSENWNMSQSKKYQSIVQMMKKILRKSNTI